MFEALEACPPVFEYISVSTTNTFTFSPEASTWSRPPNPISYAQPSPPKIHVDFFCKYCFFARMSAHSLLLLSFSSSAIRAFVGSTLSFVLSFVSMNFAIASFKLDEALLFATSSSSAIRLSRMYFCPMYIPKPCSALSSNNELAQAGPFLEPLLTVYGDVAAGLPQIEEHPVA